MAMLFYKTPKSLRVKEWFLGLIFGPEPHIFGDRFCINCKHYKTGSLLHHHGHECYARAHQEVVNPVTGEKDWVDIATCYDKNRHGTCRDFSSKIEKEEAHEIPEQHDGGTDETVDSKTINFDPLIEAIKGKSYGA